MYPKLSTEPLSAVSNHCIGAQVALTFYTQHVLRIDAATVQLFSDRQGHVAQQQHN